MYIQYQTSDGWLAADTSDPEARWILDHAAALVKEAEPMPSDWQYGSYDEDVHISVYGISADKVPAIALYLAKKGQYREGMKEMLDYIEAHGKVNIRFMD